MSETNQDSTSKASNMQILQMLVPALLPNPKPEKSRKYYILWHWIQEVTAEDVFLLDHSAFGQIPARGSTGTRNWSGLSPCN